jgi:hypothetical protein
VRLPLVNASTAAVEHAQQLVDAASR